MVDAASCGLLIAVAQHISLTSDDYRPILEGLAFLQFFMVSWGVCYIWGDLIKIQALFDGEMRGLLGRYVLFMTVRVMLGMWGQTVFVGMRKDGELMVDVQSMFVRNRLRGKVIREEGEMRWMVNFNLGVLVVGAVAWGVWFVLWWVGAGSMVIGYACGERWK